MLGREQENTRSHAQDEPTPPHPHPRIFLVDLPGGCASAVRALRLNCQTGTFGSVYESDPHKETVCLLNGNVGNLADNEIVVVDMGKRARRRVPPPAGEGRTQRAEDQCLVSPYGQNYFDPRALFSSIVQDDFEAIVRTGGVIVVFAGDRHTEKYYIADRRGHHFDAVNPSDVSSYAWLPWWVNPVRAEGDRVAWSSDHSQLVGPLAKVGGDVTYETAFDNRGVDGYVSLAKNHLGACVAFAAPWENGMLIVLPQFEDLPGVCGALMSVVLPEIAPRLFPHIEANTWVDWPQYLPNEIRELLAQREELVERHCAELLELDGHIGDAKDGIAHLNSMCTATGQRLVECVARALGDVGCDVDVCDAENALKEEDLRIGSGDCLCVVEVKGIAGAPQDSDCQQVGKYMLRRQHELARHDISGVFLVNHQKNLEPARRAAVPFSREQIADALRSRIGLGTTWALRQAVLHIRAGVLAPGDVIWSLQQPGLIRFLPANSARAGSVTHHFGDKMVAEIELDSGAIGAGDLAAFYRDDLLFKQVIASIHVNNESAEAAERGQMACVQVDSPVKKGDLLYVVRPQHAADAAGQSQVRAATDSGGRANI